MVLPAIDTFPQTLFELFKPYRNLVLYSVITFWPQERAPKRISSVEEGNVRS